MANVKKAPSKASASGTTVRFCQCAHDAQDRIYGPGKRLHLATAAGWRCTVCGRDKGRA